MRLQFGRRIRLFLGLGDTPADFSGQALKYLRVNAGENALEFGTPAGVGDMTKAVYDTNDDGAVEDSDLLEGQTLAQVRDHTPKAHKTSHETGQSDVLTPAGIGAIPAPAAPAAGDVLHYTGAAWVVLTKDVGKYLKSAAAAVEWAAVDGAGAAGEGHILILPHCYNSIGQGTFAFTTYECFMGGKSYNSAGADGDELSYKVYLDAGTYTLFLLVQIGSNAGIVDIDIDEVEVASFDCYNGSIVYDTVKKETGIVIASAGLKTLTLRMDGKNGSASDYYLHLQCICLWRTA